MSRSGISTLGALREAVARGDVPHRTVREEVRDNLIRKLRDRRDLVSRHHRLRRQRRAADGQRAALAAQLHPARPARSGEDPAAPRAHDAARRGDSRRTRLRDQRRSAGAAVRRLPRAGRHRRRPVADRLAVARLAVRREAGDAGRDHRRHGRRHRPDQGGAIRAAALERADDALRPAAAGQSRDLRDQRAARPGRQDSGRVSSTSFRRATSRSRATRSACRSTS